MKLSRSWLSDHVDLSGISSEEIAEKLTMRIALIEGIERPADAVRDVKVGRVVDVKPHPNADRLNHCQVHDGEQTYDVVCGAPNVKADQKIAYAPPGAELPGGFRLEKRKIRGILSHGMICSEREMGLGDEHDGILVLPDSAEVGQPLAEVLELSDDLFDIDNKTVTHRADLWGHYGFARELAAIFDRPLRPYLVAEDLRPEAGAFPIRLDDPQACPLYLGLLIDGVSGDRSSPDFVSRRLKAAEMRPINLLVDLSNYVMLEIGQPTHPFDRDRLKGGVVVRCAADGERLTTLDDVERRLHPDDLVIADEQRVLAIAGIMGGGESEVSATTERVLLESASFDSVGVRKTSSRLGLRTDALARFEKFLDPATAEIGLRRYAHLLREIAPEAQIAAGFATAGGAIDRARTLDLRPQRVRLKLGFDLSDAEITQRLNAIGFGVRPAGDRLQVAVPSFRAGRDIEQEDDLIEEVGRLAGYERVPSVLPRVQCTPPLRDPLRRIERRSVETLVYECGYAETLNYSFATDRQVDLYYDDSEPFLRLPHPLTQDASRLRRSLVPGLLEQISSNQLHREQIRMMEIGRCYLAGGDVAELPVEQRVLVAARLSTRADGEQTLLEARSDVEAVLRRLRLEWVSGAPQSELPRFAHPTRCIEWRIGGQPAAWAANLHPQLHRSYEFESELAVFQIDLGVLASAESCVPKMQPLPQFPSVRRDVSVLAPLSVTVGSILETVQAVSPERIVGVELFDVYRGQGIPEGQRSLAFRIEYRDEERTLTDKDVEGIHAEVVRRLVKQGMQLRG